MPRNGLHLSKRLIIYCQIFTKLLSEKKFILLFKFLHFSNNELYDEYSSAKGLFKIFLILQNFKNNYIPEVNICIDESLLIWKGRLPQKVHILSKRSGFGIKSCQICESKSGYICDLFIYIGEQTIFDDNLKNMFFGEKTYSYWFSLYLIKYIY